MKYSISDYLSDPNRCTMCGGCKHWHERKGEGTGRLALGDCDKIPKGREWVDEDSGKTYTYDGYSIEDECYDDVFGCYEQAESEEEE